MKWIKILRTGSFKDSAGVEHDFTAERLDEIEATYNGQLGGETERIAPVVLGHPKHDAPAHGWIGKLKREGDYLLAGLTDLKEEFVDAVRDGSYKMRSVSLYPDGMVRHLGFLGATQPAVSGLGAVELSEEDDATTIDFMDWETAWQFNRIGEFMTRLREFFIEKDGIDTADRLVSPWDSDALKQAKATPTPAVANEDFTEQSSQEEDMENTELQAQLDKVTADFNEATETVGALTTERDGLIAERDELQAALTAKDEQIAALTTAADEQAAATARAEFTAYVEKAIADGKMLPAERDFFVDSMVNASKATGEFNEGESPLDQIKTMIDKRSEHGLFSEVATKTGADDATYEFTASGGAAVDEDRAAEWAAAKKLAAAENIDFAEALTKIQKGSN